MKNIISNGQGQILRQLRKLIETEMTQATDGAETAPAMVIEELVTNEWASATFTGHTHVMTVRLHGAAEALWAATDRIMGSLPATDLPLPGRFLAEIAVTACAIEESGAGTSARLTIEALTIDE